MQGLRTTKYDIGFLYDPIMMFCKATAFRFSESISKMCRMGQKHTDTGQLTEIGKTTPRKVLYHDGPQRKSGD
jgi:hypothetical protein